MKFFSSTLSTAFQLSFDLFRPSRPKRKAVRRPPDDPALSEIWFKLQQGYFPEVQTLNSYQIVWSTRKHRNTLASCNVELRRVSVAAAMKHPPSNIHLEALLYHEMCHAVLGRPKVVRGRRQVHGRDFKSLERRHPGIPALDSWVKSGGWHAEVRSFNRRKLRAPS